MSLHDIVQFVMHERKQSAVLIYCSEELKQQMEGSPISFVDLDQSIDHSLLRALDNKEDSLFKVLLSSRATVTGWRFSVG